METTERAAFVRFRGVKTVERFCKRALEGRCFRLPKLIEEYPRLEANLSLALGSRSSSLSPLRAQLGNMKGISL